MAVGNISFEIVTLNQTHTLTQSLQVCALTHIHTQNGSFLITDEETRGDVNLQ